MTPEGCMSNLPSDILIDILSRLPISTIFDCRFVSKTWLDVLLSPEFAKVHLSRSPATLIINRLQSYDHYQLLKFFPLVDMQNHQDLHYIPPIKSDYSSIASITDQKVLHGSTNGFLLLSNLDNDDLYICNPMTREYITLPDVLEKGMNPPNAVIAHGFGYDAVNDEYKVVRIEQQHTYDEDMSLIHSDSDVEVYTLGSGSWRRVNYCRYYFGCHFHGNAIHLHGRLYWLIFDPREDDHFLLAFNLSDESNLMMITVPPNTNIQTSALGMVNGRLNLWNNVTDNEIEVWVLQEDEDEDRIGWAKGVEMSNPDGLGLSNKRVRILADLEDETILMEWNNYSVMSFHADRSDFETYDLCEPGIQARVDVLSFLSLKNFEKQDSDSEQDSDSDSDDWEYSEKVEKF